MMRQKEHEPGLEFQLQPILSEQFGASCLTSLSLSFLTCKMGSLIPTSLFYAHSMILPKGKKNPNIKSGVQQMFLYDRSSVPFPSFPLPCFLAETTQPQFSETVLISNTLSPHPHKPSRDPLNCKASPSTSCPSRMCTGPGTRQVPLQVLTWDSRRSHPYIGKRHV